MKRHYCALGRRRRRVRLDSRAAVAISCEGEVQTHNLRASQVLLKSPTASVSLASTNQTGLSINRLPARPGLAMPRQFSSAAEAPRSTRLAVRCMAQMRVFFFCFSFCFLGETGRGPLSVGREPREGIHPPCGRHARLTITSRQVKEAGGFGKASGATSTPKSSGQNKHYVGQVLFDGNSEPSIHLLAWQLASARRQKPVLSCL
ncbi:hypothetical protein LZ30DRAFT_75307 [Colletotrichum cereale]|nr:hypothetical protein LZ30DRAFT_75307 [Colletotrichum cereale]